MICFLKISMTKNHYKIIKIMIFMINEIVTIYIYNKNIQITYKTNINKIKI